MEARRSSRPISGSSLRTASPESKSRSVVTRTQHEIRSTLPEICGATRQKQARPPAEPVASRRPSALNETEWTLSRCSSGRPIGRPVPVSQSCVVRSRLAVARIVLSGRNARHSMLAPWTSDSPIGWPRSECQSRAVPLAQAVAIKLPDGLNSTRLTSAGRLNSRAMVAPVRFQSQALPSRQPVKYEPASPKKEKCKGRARKKGNRLPGMKQWADDPDRPWTELEFDQFGLHPTLAVKTIQALY